MPEDCVFCKIGAGQIPVQPVYEDDEFVAFRDLNPQAPIHVLLIPRAHYSTLMDMQDPGLMGRALLAVQQIARALGMEEEGFRVVVNCRDNGGQTVYHVHLHVLGGRFMQWPPG
ncbi:MAG TPA: histidine triad nucleotide-binding protein [Chthonomonadaceae bacterium]|nr:histidine triad nucleotide-binding protein [Chthonomonadaceae bacterium]